ncbi:MAG: ABC transporter permease [Thermoleophilia bacterium]|nr:ABC transporter permease [Thermoleophilia bacterium]
MRSVWFLLGKDLRTLARSPALLAALVLYPLLIALLVGLVARFATDRPRVGFVDLDKIPETVVVGGQRFQLDQLIDQVETEAELVPLSEAEAKRQLRTGEIVAAIVVPRGFVSRLRSRVRRPTLKLRITRGGLSGRVERQTEALVYNLNRRLQDAYIDANLEYVRLLREGGSGDFLGNQFDIVGLEGAREILGALDARSRDPGAKREIDELETFVDEALLALKQTGETLRATANPITLRTEDEGRREWLLSAQVQAYVLALTIALLSILIAAAGIAAERDENVLGRLTRGLVRLGELVAEKIALVAVVAVALGLVLTLVLGIAIEVAGSTSFASWTRLPVLAAGIALAAAAFGALGVLLGVLARETRAAALVAILVALPVVLLGFLPEIAIQPAAWVSSAFPFSHSVRLFESTLYDVDPWPAVARETAWLLGLGAAFAFAARLGIRRLLA